MSAEGIGDAVRSFLRGGRPTAGPAAQAGAPGAGAPAGDPALASLAAEARQGGRRSGKARASAEEALAAAQLQDAIDELYTPENWEEVGQAYFELRYATTGFDGFRLSEKQKNVMARSLAMTMKTLAITDPKWIALTIFGINFGGLIAQKEMAFAKYAAAQKADRKS